MPLGLAAQVGGGLKGSITSPQADPTNNGFSTRRTVPYSDTFKKTLTTKGVGGL